MIEDLALPSFSFSLSPPRSSSSVSEKAFIYIRARALPCRRRDNNAKKGSLMKRYTASRVRELSALSVPRNTH